jgi:hypothetical protein
VRSDRRRRAARGDAVVPQTGHFGIFADAAALDVAARRLRGLAADR